VGFVHGHIEQRFLVTFYWWLGASLLAGLLTIPSWPCLFQRHPVVWADEAAAASAAAAAAAGSGASASGKLKRK
jgi:hypothetical protein